MGVKNGSCANNVPRVSLFYDFLYRILVLFQGSKNKSRLKINFNLWQISNIGQKVKGLPSCAFSNQWYWCVMILENKCSFFIKGRRTPPPCKSVLQFDSPIPFYVRILQNISADINPQFWHEFIIWRVSPKKMFSIISKLSPSFSSARPPTRHPGK